MSTLHTNLRFSLKLLGMAILMFGTRLWFIKIAGTSLPYFDEWEVGFYTLLPAFNGHLNLSDLLVPYGEHPIVLIRLLTLGLTVLNDGQWEPLLQMIVNAVLYSLTAVIFAVILRNWLDHRLENWIILSITLMGVIPVGWINIIWGFQSSWYLLSLLTLLTLWGLLLYEVLTWQWAIGLVCGILSCVNLASGFFVLVVVVIFQLYLILVNRDHIRSHLFTLGVSSLLIIVSLVQLIQAPKHSELYSRDILTFITSLGKFLAWPWVDYPLLSLLMYMPFLVLLTTVIWRRQPLWRGELFILALGCWILLQAVAMAFARGAGDGVHPIARYWEIMSIGVIINFFSFHYLTQPNHGLPNFITTRINLIVHGWGILLLCGIYVLMVEAVPHIKVKLANSKEQLANVRNFLNTGELKALKAYPTCPYPLSPILASFLKRPNFQKLLPPSLTVPSQVPQSRFQSETISTFIPNGVYPTTKTRGEKMLGSYNTQQNAAVGHFESVFISPPKQPFMAIPISGYLGEKDLSLRLEVEGQPEPIWLTPYKVAREGLVPIYLPTPTKSFKIVAEDNNPKLWFAFAMPRGIGKLSMYVQLWLREWQLIITIGFLFLALTVNPKTFDSLTRPMAKRN